MSDPGRPGIVLTPLCARCQHQFVVHDLKMSEADPWQAGLVVAQVLLVQQVLARPDVTARTEGQVENISRVLAESGCLGCRFEAERVRVGRIVARGLPHASQVSRGVVLDDDHVPLAPPEPA